MEDKLKILLCEDDENLGTLTREYLEDKGYKAELFADGEAGYKAFLKGKYDICLLDVMMPKKDGYQLAQEIRAVNSDVPIIFLTAKALKEDVLEGFLDKIKSERDERIFFDLLEGLDNQEIAKREGITESAATMAVFHLRQRLRGRKGSA